MRMCSTWFWPFTGECLPFLRRGCGSHRVELMSGGSRNLSTVRHVAEQDAVGRADSSDHHPIRDVFTVPLPNFPPNQHHPQIRPVSCRFPMAPSPSSTHHVPLRWLQCPIALISPLCTHPGPDDLKPVTDIQASPSGSSGSTSTPTCSPPKCQ